MPLDAATIYAFFLVFVRCSGLFIASPMFGANNTPVSVRVFATLVMSMALTAILRPSIGEIPPHMGGFVLAVLNELAAGLLIGAFFSLILHAATMAGAFIDLQMGLGLSQALNPVTGVPVTVVGQFKYLLSLVLFLRMDGHHLLLSSFVQSYQSMPTLSAEALPSLQVSMVGLVSALTLLGIQMAAPVAAVSFVVDAALGLVNRAVPQMQTLIVGMPAKVLMGLVALSVGLPALAGTVEQGLERTTTAITEVLK